jgi:hypothetical protein
LFILEDELAQQTGWTVVVIEDTTASDAIELKYLLVADGLILDQDFTWTFRQSRYDGFSMGRPSHTAFAFRNESLATFYRLKWT